jgi:microcystin-dependent protein
MANFTKSVIAAAVLAAGSLVHSAPAQAAVDPFLGEVMLVGYNFCPRGWASTEGQLLAISQNSALFSLLGTIYGGDGRTTFALPDLRSRVPLGQGTGSGLSTVNIGQKGGAEAITQSAGQMPSHTHTSTAVSTLNASAAPGDNASPIGNLAKPGHGQQLPDRCRHRRNERHCRYDRCNHR